MYLDDKGHVHWDGVGPYSDGHKILAFITTFPGADMHELRKVVPAKLRHLQRTLSGEIFWTINGVKRPMSEADVQRTRDELATGKRSARCSATLLQIVDLSATLLQIVDLSCTRAA